MVRFRFIGAAALVAGLATVANASPIRVGGVELPLTASAGAGEHTAYLVLDFAHTGGGVHAFGYHWSGDADAEAMLRGLDDASDDLTLTWSEWGGSFLLDRIAFGTGPATDTDTGDQDLAFFNWGGDGWVDPWVGVSDITLAGDQAGVSDPTLSTWVLGFRQSWYDTGETNEWGPIWALEAPPAATVVPEPATLALLVMGAAVAARRRLA